MLVRSEVVDAVASSVVSVVASASAVVGTPHRPMTKPNSGEWLLPASVVLSAPSSTNVLSVCSRLFPPSNSAVQPSVVSAAASVVWKTWFHGTLPTSKPASPSIFPPWPCGTFPSSLPPPSTVFPLPFPISSSDGVLVCCSPGFRPIQSPTSLSTSPARPDTWPIMVSPDFSASSGNSGKEIEAVLAASGAAVPSPN